MSFGLLDLPAPALDAIDGLLEAVRLPALLRVAYYAAMCAWIGMRIYARLSDQTRMTALREEIAQTQRALATHQGSFADLNVLIRRNLRSSLRQLGLTLLPALIASMPLLFVLPWLSNRFGLEPPLANAPVTVCVQPAAAAGALRPATSLAPPVDGCWTIAWPAGNTGIAFVDARGAATYALPAAPRSDIVHKFTFYNWLIGNPDGYLPEAMPADAIHTALNARALIAIGPGWMRGWEFPFFLVLIGVSLVFKLRWGLH